MMNKVQEEMVMALDVGSKRIGVAYADSVVRIPVAYGVVTVDGTEIAQLARLIAELRPGKMVVGYPRNQSGEATHQTAVVEAFAKKLTRLNVPLFFQDESLTSVHAEALLEQSKKPYSKADIDAKSAALILSDYMEATYV